MEHRGGRIIVLPFVSSVYPINEFIWQTISGQRRNHRYSNNQYSFSKDRLSLFSSIQLLKKILFFFPPNFSQIYRILLDPRECVVQKPCFNHCSNILEMHWQQQQQELVHDFVLLYLNLNLIQHFWCNIVW